jgi:hypothetical protein
MNDAGETSIDEKTSRAGLIADVENRLQFNTFVSNFFGTLLYSFSRSLDKPDADAGKLLMHSAILTVLYVMSYAIFESGRSLVPKWCLKLIGELFLLNAALFVLPMGLIAASEFFLACIPFRSPLYDDVTFSGHCGGIVAGAWLRGREWIRAWRPYKKDSKSHLMSRLRDERTISR